MAKMSEEERRDRLANSLQFEPEERTSEAAANRKYTAPGGQIPGSSYIADLNGWRVTQDMLRHPSGKHWSEIVKICSVIKTSYETGPYIVESISEYSVYGVKVLSFVLSKENASRKKDGTMSGEPDGWINEIVAVDGRLLKLFKGSDDEVFVTGEFNPVNVQVKLF
jgi:hypothetical protein